MRTADLIDAAKARQGWPSDYRLGKVLGVTSQTVSQWRSGVSYPELLSIYRLAEFAGQEPAAVVASIEYERAQRNGRSDAAGAWEAMLSRLSTATAAAILGAVLIGPSEARAARVQAAEPLKIMSTRLRRQLRRMAASGLHLAAA